MIFRFLLFFAFLLLLDLYAFQAIKVLCSRLAYRNIIYAAYWISSIGLLVIIFFMFKDASRMAGQIKQVPVIPAAALIMSIVPKLVLVVFMLGEDIFRSSKGVITYVYSKIFSTNTTTGYVDSRRKFIASAAVITAGIPFFSILHGVIKGRYAFRTVKQTLYFNDLPAAFDGFTITQLSDIHSGSFDNYEAVKRGVDLANEQKSDLLLFTGDLVNNEAKEIEPWIELFATLDAPYGKYSIFGNHDYGDYIEWPSFEEKHKNLETLAAHHKTIGFNLLRNQHVVLEKDGEKFFLAGVENWGKPPFPQHGDINKALQGIENKDFTVLMSHDPSHWKAQVVEHSNKVHLTLSGHTHGMQFGIEIPGFKWSPVKFKYPEWAGSYEQNGKKLYVNRGFGFLGFPGRVGIWPEITVITLKKA